MKLYLSEFKVVKKINKLKSLKHKPGLDTPLSFDQTKNTRVINGYGLETQRIWRCLSLVRGTCYINDKPRSILLCLEPAACIPSLSDNSIKIIVITIKNF